MATIVLRIKKQGQWYKVYKNDKKTPIALFLKMSTADTFVSTLVSFNKDAGHVVKVVRE